MTIQATTPARRLRLTPAVALGLTSLAAVLANASWFSATAVVPALARQWRLSPAGAAWLVIVVQIGFVVGSLGAGLLNLPDRLEPRRLIAAASVLAAITNGLLLFAPGLAIALPVRFLVGVTLAGVYAPGVRLVSTYFVRGRGFATGVVVGALTLGSATPNLVRGFSDVGWQPTILVTSATALMAAAVISPVRSGPAAVTSPPLDMSAAAMAIVRQPPLRLVTAGYLGHMWELYALWAWMAAFFVAARRAGVGTAPSVTETGLVAFGAIGVAGMAGSMLAGRLADRIGRTTVTSAAMALSAACCLGSPFAFAGNAVILVAVLTVWGAAVIADSAQFSAAATELAEPRYAGSVIALQLALGFAVTVMSIRLVPIVADVLGWRFALLPLAAGPLLGTAAMLRLRALPAARRLAGGRR